MDFFYTLDLTFEETKLYKALLGVRGMGSVDMDQLIQIMVRFSVLILDLPEIKDLEKSDDGGHGVRVSW